MDVKCENPPTSKQITQARQTNGSPEETIDKPKIQRRRNSEVAAGRYNTRSSKVRKPAQRKNSGTFSKSGKRPQAGRARLGAQNKATRKPSVKRVNCKTTTFNYDSFNELKALPKQEPSTEYTTQANLSENSSGSLSGARRLLFPNAAQNIATFVPDQEVRVEFIVHQSDLPKLTEFLGEPVLEQINHDPIINGFRPSDMGDLYQTNELYESNVRPMSARYAVTSNPMHRFATASRVRKPLFQTSSSSYDLPIDYGRVVDTHSWQPQPILNNKICVQNIKFYFHQLTPQEQIRFLEEMTTELNQKRNLPADGIGLTKREQNA